MEFKNIAENKPQISVNVVFPQNELFSFFPVATRHVGGQQSAQEEECVHRQGAIRDHAAAHSRQILCRALNFPKQKLQKYLSVSVLHVDVGVGRAASVRVAQNDPTGAENPNAVQTAQLTRLLALGQCEKLHAIIIEGK